MSEKKSLIIIPTYNEKENIEKLIHHIFRINKNLNILIIDDNSPDGTADLVKNLQKHYDNLALIERPGKLGLGSAYVRGFEYALEHEFDFIFEMDADYSHDPDNIPLFWDMINNADLVIGSRYIKGVNVVNWPMHRLLLSWFANLYTRIITGLPLHDATSGYKCFRRDVLESIDLTKIKSGGYSFQIEMNFKTWKKGFRLKEIPIIFIDRTVGKSKMSKKIIREAVWMVWKLKAQSIFGLIK